MDHQEPDSGYYYREKRILVVYNNYNIIGRFLSELTKAKITTDAFVDPVLALRTFIDREYNMLLLEPRLRNISGFEFSSMITKIRKIVVCYVTPMYWYYNSLRETHLNLGNDCFISPVMPLKNFREIILQKLYDGDKY